MEIAGTTRGTGYDGIDVGGALTYGGALTLTSNTLIGVGTYNLFDFTGDNASESGDFSSITLSGTAYASNAFIQDGDVWDAIVDNQTYTLLAGHRQFGRGYDRSSGTRNFRAVGWLVGTHV